MLDGTLLFVFLLVNRLFVLSSGILTCNCIRRTYLLSVDTHTFLFVSNGWKCFHYRLVFCFGLQNMNRAFVPTSKPLNMLDGTLLFVFLLVNRLFVLSSGILTCNCIRRTYLLSVDTHTFLFVSNGWKCFHYCLVFCFGLQNINRTFVPFSIPRNMMDRGLFVVRLLVNTLFLLFSGILSSICIRRTYLVAVYTLKTRSTPYCLFLRVENVTVTFGVVLWLSKHQPYLCSNFETSKYVRLSLVCCLFACRYVISAVFRHFNL